MQFTLDQIRMLASNGSPLHITITSPDKDTPEVQVQGRGTFPAPHNHYTGHLETHLTRALKYYPDPVTINGTPIKRYNFPDLAKVTWESYPDRNTISPLHGNLQVHPCSPPVDEPFNLLAAGVLCQLPTPPMAQTQCHTPEPGDHPHWQPARTLTITSVPSITPEQFQEMDQHQWDALSDPKALTPLKVQLLREADLQVQRTLNHPGMPPIHPGPVYAYLLAADPAPGYFAHGAPIIVHRTPVVFDGDHLPQPAVISASETLYTTDQELVPVAKASNREYVTVPRILNAHPTTLDQPHMVITDVVVRTEPHKLFSTPPSIRKLDSITMTLTLENNGDTGNTGDTLDFPAPFWLLGDTVNDRIILHADPELTTQALTDAILRAYWRDDNIASKDQEDLEIEQAEYDAMFMAQAALQNPVQAYADQLKQYMEYFPSDIPFPNRPITFTTQSGNITVTITPKTRTDNHEQHA